PEDLPILCERHTTSKLRAFEDLESMATLGFRGEALASLTFVSHLTVTTMTAGQTHGFRAQYRDGELEGAAVACAAVQGTQVLVDDLLAQYRDGEMQGAAVVCAAVQGTQVLVDDLLFNAPALPVAQKSSTSPHPPHRAQYRDGELEGPPVACAAVQGTQVVVDDLFFNVPARRKAFRSHSEEYARILDVLSRFAIHNYDVCFSCKKVRHGCLLLTRAQPPPPPRRSALSTRTLSPYPALISISPSPRFTRFVSPVIPQSPTSFLSTLRYSARGQHLFTPGAPIPGVPSCASHPSSCFLSPRSFSSCLFSWQYGEARTDLFTPGAPKQEARAGGKKRRRGKDNGKGLGVESSAEGRAEGGGEAGEGERTEGKEEAMEKGEEETEDDEEDEEEAEAERRRRQVEAVRAVYGAAVARDLIPIAARRGGWGEKEGARGEGEGVGEGEGEGGEGGGSDEGGRGDGVQFSMRGLISSANYSAKKTTMVLFINNRLVECSPLRKACEATYAAILPKAARPFLYLALSLPPHHVDVNVHPTKREVGFLNQDEVVAAVQHAVQQAILSSNHTRTFYTHSNLLAASTPPLKPPAGAAADPSSPAAAASSPATKPRPPKHASPASLRPPEHRLVRTDARIPAGRLHAFFSHRPSSSQPSSSQPLPSLSQPLLSQQPLHSQPLLAQSSSSQPSCAPAASPLDSASQRARGVEGGEEEEEGREEFGGQGVGSDGGGEGETRADLVETASREEEEGGHAEKQGARERRDVEEADQVVAPQQGRIGSAAAVAGPCVDGSGAAGAEGVAAPCVQLQAGLVGSSEQAAGDSLAATRFCHSASSPDLRVHPSCARSLTIADWCKQAGGEEEEESQGGSCRGRRGARGGRSGRRGAADERGGAHGRDLCTHTHSLPCGEKQRLESVLLSLLLFSPPHPLLVAALSALLADCTYVGMVDDRRMLLQHSTSLYLVDAVSISKELMWQQAIRRFARFTCMTLHPPPLLADLLLLALQEEERAGGRTGAHGCKQEMVEAWVQAVQGRAEMLAEYFALTVSPDGHLLSLPLLLDHHTPDLTRLPSLALALANEVEWDEEKACFASLAAALADFFAFHAPLLPRPSANQQRKDTNGEEREGGGQVRGEEDGDASKEWKVRGSEEAGDEESARGGRGADVAASTAAVTIAGGGEVGVSEEGGSEEGMSEVEVEAMWRQWEWSIQHVLLPALKFFLKPPKRMARDGSFIKHAFAAVIVFAVTRACVAF
ncbi:unnamed protein product, partial [Closterium sp. Naga37s-1]